MKEKIKELIKYYKEELEIAEEGFEENSGPYCEMGLMYNMDIQHYTRSIKDLERILENE